MSTRWGDVIRFMSIVDGMNENGYPEAVEEIDEHETFANKKSVRSAEFYQASAIGIGLEAMFEVRSLEYDGQTKLIYNDKLYDVTRTYDKGEIIELICAKGTSRKYR